MTDSLLSALNPVQREAVAYLGGPELVLAGAGSGKTRVIAYKIAHLIRSGVHPWKILAVTFTNKSAAEMRERVASLVGENLEGMQVSTFHSYGLRFLRRYPQALERLGLPRDFVVYDRDDSKKLVRRLIEERNLDPKVVEPGAVLDRISRAKGEASPVTRLPRSMEGRDLELYKAYQDGLRRQGACDFDDLLLSPLHVLTVDSDVARQERERLDWVLVDEYQDVNSSQYLTLRALTKESGRLLAVGDPDQAIYGWRGADMRMILNFERDFPGAKTFVLSQNYRSTGSILSAANAVIRNNPERPPKDLWTASDRGRRIEILKSADDGSEASALAERIEELRGEGFAYGDMAILYRINALSRTYEEALLERSLPYRVIRGTAFYERKEVRDVLSLLRLAVNPRDRIALERIGNVPVRGLGKKGLSEVGDFLAAQPGGEAPELWGLLAAGIPSLSARTRTPALRLSDHMARILEFAQDPRGAIRFVLDGMGYAEYLRQEDPDRWEERVENVFELLSLLPAEGSLAEMLAEATLFTDRDQEDDGGDRVNLLTLHAAKGLEFPVVFLVGMEEGIFPHSRCLEEPEGVREERRLCYVGMTRAMQRLFLCGAEARVLFGSIWAQGFSRFLDEVPAECVSLVDRTGEGRNCGVGRRDHRRHWRW
jgi:DNA helicase-2/ATP-dependent DNA helicase PcrA